jgi:hypothetical protein
MIIMFTFITKRFLQTALFGVIGVTAACGGVAIGSVLAEEPLRGDDGLAVIGLLGCVAVAGGSLMCAAGAATDED